VHAHQGRRASAATSSYVIFVNDEDFPRLAFGELKCNRCAHHARAEDDEAGRLQPLGSGIQSPYIAYVRSRVDALAGDPVSAVARLRSILAVPAQQSRGWLAIDRTLAPLRGNAEFEALIRHP